MTGLTKSGRPDMRRRENRRGPQLSASEIEEMIALILPGVRGIAKQFADVGREIERFRQEHPELAGLEREYARAMEANNKAVMPLWGLLNKLAEQDEERWRRWCDFLNGDGPDPRAKEEDQ